ncbi:MAG: VCBS repeat-containing protein [Magnetococcales bacterium]|nr:VCBS repeat-containing protein [Nitrospirota bacterium]
MPEQPIYGEEPPPPPPPPTGSKLTVAIAGAGTGKVTGGDGFTAITCSSGNVGTCSADYDADTSITLTATEADANSKFDNGWTGCDSTSGTNGNICKLNMPATDKTVTATFTASTAPTTHTITSSVVGGNGTIAPLGPQTINHNATASFTVTPDAEYTPSVIGCSGTLSSSTYTTAPVTADCDVIATFTLTPTPGTKARYDFNADGQSEILWQNTTTGDIVIWAIDRSSLKYTSRDLVEKRIPSAWQILAVEDFDGDGKSDILWENTNNYAVYIWFMNSLTAHGAGARPDTYWINPGTGSPSPRLWQIEGFGDFNKDGVADILWRNTESGDVAIWLMSVNGILDQYLVEPAPVADWQFKAIGDFDGDSKADVLWQGTNGDVSVWLMKDKGTSPDKATVGVISSDWQFKAAGDFNGDGKADVLWQNTNGDLVIWSMNGSQNPTKKPIEEKIPSDWQFRATGDYDGDGTADILWQNANGDLAVWTMKDSASNQKIYADKEIPSQWQVIGR